MSLRPRVNRRRLSTLAPDVAPVGFNQITLVQQSLPASTASKGLCAHACVRVCVLTGLSCTERLLFTPTNVKAQDRLVEVHLYFIIF